MGQSRISDSAIISIENQLARSLSNFNDIIVEFATVKIGKNFLWFILICNYQFYYLFVDIIHIFSFLNVVLSTNFVVKFIS